MFHKFVYVGLLTVSVLLAGNAQATQLSAVAYGTIVAVSQQEKDTSGGTAGGAIVGGLLGLATGKGKSGSNKALRTLGGAGFGIQLDGILKSFFSFGNLFFVVISFADVIPARLLIIGVQLAGLLEG